MTKKIDEAASLNVSTQQGEMSSTTTFTADDVAGLAAMLKNAGIAGNSAMFNGPATLTMDVQESGGTMNSTIQAPDLRSIMQLLEPEFQASAEMEPEMDPALAQAHADMDTMHADGHEVGVEIYDPGMSPYDADVDKMADAQMADNAQDAMDAEMDAEMDLEAPAAEPMIADSYELGFADAQRHETVDEEAVTESIDDDQFDILDEITQGPALSANEGVNDDCEVGDDLMTLGWIRVPNATLEDEASHGEFFDYAERIEQMVNPPAGYTLDNYGIYTNEYDATESGKEFVSIAFGFYVAREENEIEEEADYDYREADVHPHAYAGKASREVVQPDSKMVPARSGDNPLKTFREYVEETANRNTPAIQEVEEATIATMESLLDEFRLEELSNDVKNSYFKKAGDSINGHAQHAANMRGIGNDEQAEKHEKKIMQRAHGMNRAIAKEGELDEAGRADYNQKRNQYGEPYYLNTDCGFASLESIMRAEGFFDDMEMGLAQHATKVGITVLEIERSGKKGYNYVNSPDTRLQPGTPVTCITQTSTGDKFRPGRFIASFTAKDLSMNYDQVVAALAKLGITPSKKLPVKTFD